MKNDNKEAYNEHFQKALLYFDNPFLLDQLINEKNGTVDVQFSDSKEEDQEYPDPPKEKKEIEFNSEVQIPQPEEKKMSSENEFVFEPYHTVDYFASQGIKIREEETPKDRFGQQLKSFTAWLKTMKRLPGPEKADEEKSIIERKVDELAEHSIEDREVITETMAEVWEKQGDAQKAIDIYNKLSLQDPSKSSYFAAKIEQLKNRLI